MLAINISYNSIKLLEIRKNFLGKKNIKSLDKVEFKKDEEWSSKPIESPKDKKIGFTIPDSKVFLKRFEISSYITGENLAATVLDTVKKEVPVSLEKLVFDSAKVNTRYKSSNHDIIFIGVTYETLIPYYKKLQEIQAKSLLLVPESLAVFAALKAGIEEEEIVLYIGAESKEASFTFLDKLGPISGLLKTIDSKSLEKEIKKEISAFEEKNKKKVKKIVIGGEESGSWNAESIGETLGVAIVKADNVIQSLLNRSKIKLSDDYTSKLSFLPSLGLALLSFEKNTLNLAQKNMFSRLQKMTKLEKEEETNPKNNEVNVAQEETAIHKPEDKKDELESCQEKKREETPASDKKKGRPKIFLVLGIAIAIILISAASFLLLQNFQSNKALISKDAKNEAYKIPEKPSPTPTPKILREDLKILIENGNGKTGAASEALQLLKEKGYTQLEVKNADNYDYVQTVIKIKETKKSFLQILTDDLKTNYDIDSDVKFLDKDSKFDIIIILGAK